MQEKGHKWNISQEIGFLCPFSACVVIDLEWDLVELLNIATKNQLFQFEGNLYEQVDGVAMGSPLGPLMANAFMCSIEERLLNQGKMPIFYKRYVTTRSA